MSRFCWPVNMLKIQSFVAGLIQVVYRKPERYKEANR